MSAGALGNLPWGGAVHFPAEGRSATRNWRVVADVLCTGNGRAIGPSLAPASLRHEALANGVKEERLKGGKAVEPVMFFLRSRGGRAERDPPISPSWMSLRVYGAHDKGYLLGMGGVKGKKGGKAILVENDK